MFFRKRKKRYTTDGYVTLISVLIIGAIGSAITLSLILIGLRLSQSSFALEQSYQAQALADACAELALQQIRNSTPYTGSDTLSLGQGSCTYTVVSTGGQNREIESTGIVNDSVRRVFITIDAINPSINVVEWQEVSDF